MNGRPTDVYVVASVASGHAITNPDWVRKPTGDDLSSFYPQVAWASGLSGKAVVQCSVMANGGLKDCLILEESPRGIGFGDALLRMTDKFQMRPQVIDGKPVEGGTVVIPVHFEPPDNVPKVTPDSSGSFKVLPWAPWIEAPTAADVAAAFPPRALASRTFGSGALRCRFKPDGHLTECEQTLDGAPNTAFNEAVKRLAPKFRANLESLKPFGLGRFRIAISVTFSERALRPAAERYVRQPEWLRSPDADAVLQAFPDRAVQAGVLTGKAVVDCLIGATGMLEGCATKSQEPDGLDFGLSGEKVASLMQANLWTNDGEAAPGQHVLLPIRFIYRPAKSDSAAAPASKPGA